MLCSHRAFCHLPKFDHRQILPNLLSMGHVYPPRGLFGELITNPKLIGHGEINKLVERVKC